MQFRLKPTCRRDSKQSECIYITFCYTDKPQTIVYMYAVNNII